MNNQSQWQSQPMNSTDAILLRAGWIRCKWLIFFTRWRSPRTGKLWNREDAYGITQEWMDPGFHE